MPRGYVQCRVPSIVPTAEKLPQPVLLHAIPGVANNGLDRVGVPVPRRAVEGRVERRVDRGEEGAVPEAELGDEAAVALTGGDVQERAALRGYLAGSAAVSRVNGLNQRKIALSDCKNHELQMRSKVLRVCRNGVGVLQR